MDKLTLIDIEKKYKDNPPTDEEILERWTRLGLLKGLKSKELKMEIAKAFESMANTLCFGELDGEEIKHNKWFEVVIFPIIHRTIRSYYYKHNEPKSITTKDYIDFFKNTSVNDIFEKTLNTVYDNRSFDGEILIEDEINKNIKDRQDTKEYFNKRFETFGKDTKLIDFNYYLIFAEMEKTIPLDIEAEFTAMISEAILYTLFEK